MPVLLQISGSVRVRNSELTPADHVLYINRREWYTRKVNQNKDRAKLWTLLRWPLSSSALGSELQAQLNVYHSVSAVNFMTSSIGLLPIKSPCKIVWALLWRKNVLERNRWQEKWCTIWNRSKTRKRYTSYQDWTITDLSNIWILSPLYRKWCWYILR